MSPTNAPSPEYSARNLPQAQLAEDAGISTNFLSQLEGSHKQPSLEVIDRLAAALGIRAFQLFVDPAGLPAGDPAVTASVKQFLDGLSRQIDGFSKQFGKGR